MSLPRFFASSSVYITQNTSSAPSVAFVLYLLLVEENTDRRQDVVGQPKQIHGVWDTKIFYFLPDITEILL
jgi:hypothetical protein